MTVKETSSQPSLRTKANQPERRRNVRVAPAVTAPVLVYIGQGECQAIDISLGGIAIDTLHEHCNLTLPKPGLYFEASILLPHEASAFQVYLEQLGARPEGQTRCAFRELTDISEKKLDHYISQRVREIVINIIE